MSRLVMLGNSNTCRSAMSAPVSTAEIVCAECNFTSDGEPRMARVIPVFETQMRGFHRAQVTDYLLHIHGEIESLQEHIRMLERDASYAEADRERLNTELGTRSSESA